MWTITHDFSAIDGFDAMPGASGTPEVIAAELQERGFVSMPGPYPAARMARLADAYDAAIEAASADEVRIGSTSTRMSDFVNRGADFDPLYIFPPLLAAARLVIGQPFKLSSLHARTVRPDSPEQDLHVDVPRDSPDWPLLGFILMVDEFRPDNGATRFVSGSHRWSDLCGRAARDRDTDQVEALASGTAGSLIVFNGSVLHGHSANASAIGRRSLQGAFIPRGGRSSTDFLSRMSPETRARLSPLALRLVTA